MRWQRPRRLALTVAAAGAMLSAGCSRSIIGDSGAPSGDGDAVPTPARCPYATGRPGLGAPLTTWEQAGPPGGSVRSILALGGETVVVGTGAWPEHTAGIYRTTAAAGAYTLSRRFTKTSVTALVVVPGTTRIYAGVGSRSGSPDDGVYLSTDGGATFDPVNAGLPALDAGNYGRRLRRLSVAATSGQSERLYALFEGSGACASCATASLYRLDDQAGGGVFQAAAMNNVLEGSDGPALAMVADVTDRDRVYLANDTTFFASADGGEYFTATTFGSTAFPPSGLAQIVALHADPRNAAHLLVSTTGSGLVESTDGGLSFTTAAPDFSTSAFTDVAFTESGLFATTDGDGLLAGSSASTLAPTGQCLVPVALTAVALPPDHPNGANPVYVGAANGAVWSSADGGVTFTPSATGIDELSGRLRVTEIAGVYTLWLLSGGGVFRSADLGGSWERLDIGPHCVADLAQDPDDPDRVLLATHEEAFAGCPAGHGVLAASLSESTVRRATGLDGRNVKAIAFDPSTTSPHARRVFAFESRGEAEPDTPGIPPTGLYLSTDSGGSFAATNLVGVPTDDFGDAPLVVTSDGVVFLGMRPAGANPEPTLWRSADQGSTATAAWSEVWRPTGIIVDPTGALLMSGWFGGGVGLKRSTDLASPSFAPFDAALTTFDRFVNAMAKGSMPRLLIATESGVQYAADGGATDGSTFAALNDGLPAGAAGASVAVIPGASDTGFVITKGFGMFRRQLP
ncbi:MAG: hypothetical protein HY903_00925 [Deltaproteobacteria bacterium]|nr:hypothetical protein [Deltaproteobacteria bacterium]